MRVVSLSDATPVRGNSRPVKFVSLDRSLLYAGTEEKTDSYCESLNREANRSATRPSQNQRRGRR